MHLQHTAVTLPKHTTVGLLLPYVRAILYLDEGMQSENAVVDTEYSQRGNNEPHWESTLDVGEAYKERGEELKDLLREF